MDRSLIPLAALLPSSLTDLVSSFKIVPVSVLGVSHFLLARSLPKLVLFLLSQKGCLWQWKEHRLGGKAELGGKSRFCPVLITCPGESHFSLLCNSIFLGEKGLVMGSCVRGLSGRALSEKLHKQDVSECLASRRPAGNVSYFLLPPSFSLTQSLVSSKDNPGGAVPFGAGWSPTSPRENDHLGSFGEKWDEMKAWVQTPKL